MNLNSQDAGNNTRLLVQPVTLGKVELENRIIMAPLTRFMWSTTLSELSQLLNVL